MDISIVNAETGEPVAAYTGDLIGVKVIVQTAEGTTTDWIDEAYCPFCEAYYIGLKVGVGGFLARHDFLHRFESGFGGIEA
jgi:hypothetical protein